MSSRPNWSRPLPQRLIIPRIMTMTTLGDVRELIDKRMPKEFRDRPTWQHVRATLQQAAAGSCEPVEVMVALRLVLQLERVPCEVKPP